MERKQKRKIKDEFQNEFGTSLQKIDVFENKEIEKTVKKANNYEEAIMVV